MSVPPPPPDCDNQFFHSTDDVFPGHPMEAKLAMYGNATNPVNVFSTGFGNPAEAAVKFPIFRALANQHAWCVTCVNLGLCTT